MPKQMFKRVETKIQNYPTTVNSPSDPTPINSTTLEILFYKIKNFTNMFF